MTAAALETLANIAGVLGLAGGPDQRNPAAQLQVAPVTFQSVEQEGRWKPAGLVNTERTFEVKPPPGTVPNQAAAPAAGAPPRAANPVAPLQFHRRKLFRVQTAGDNWFEVWADWWSDGWEIYGGLAALGAVDGFTFGQLGTTAAAVLSAVPFGNYFPAAVLITWTGWLNPVGPAYYDFRGWTVIQAANTAASRLTSAGTTSAGGAAQGSQSSPPYGSYMDWWQRDGSRPVSAPLDGSGALVMSVNPPPSKKKTNADDVPPTIFRRPGRD